MTQARPSRPRLPTVILGGGVLLFVVSLAWTQLRQALPPLAPPAAAGRGNPLALLEQRVKDQPDDGEAWHALAAQLFDAGRYADAVPPYERSVALLPGRAILWSALGEARVMASARDPMPPQALADFRRAAAIDPKDPRARYFLAVARDLRGRHEEAIGQWLALLADTPPGAAWEKDLRRTIEQVGRINAIPVDARIAAAARVAAPLAPAAPSPMATAPLPGPGAGEMQAAARLSAGDQRRMAEGMVARLEQRLRDHPAHLDGWVMLMRSRMTLGQPAAASAALAQAIARNPAQADELKRQAATLSVR